MADVMQVCSSSLRRNGPAPLERTPEGPGRQGAALEEVVRFRRNGPARVGPVWLDAQQDLLLFASFAASSSA